MGTRSTIMDTNSFRPENAATLDEYTRQLTQKREQLLGVPIGCSTESPFISYAASCNIFGTFTAISIWTCITTSPASVIVTRPS